jgi:hypothetical protein
MGEKLSASEMSRACHGIIDAASALIANVEFLAGACGQQAEAIEDARRSITRIVALAKEVRESVTPVPIVPPGSDGPASGCS